MKRESPSVPASNVDVVHAGVIPYLEVHYVVVPGGVAILVKHHQLRHVVELQFSQIFLKHFLHCFTKILYKRILLANRLKMLSHSVNLKFSTLKELQSWSNK